MDYLSCRCGLPLHQRSGLATWWKKHSLLYNSLSPWERMMSLVLDFTEKIKRLDSVGWG